MAAIADQNAKPARIVSGVLLALLVTKSSRKASDEAIEVAVNTAEALTLLFGIAVIVGVGAEYALPVFGLVPVGNWPAAAVAIGVAGELLFGFRGSRLQGEQLRRSDVQLDIATNLANRAEHDASAARRELAEATNRLAESEKRTADLEQLTAWRRVTAKQREHLVAVIPQYADEIDLLIEFQSSDGEALTYARGIGEALWNAGVRKIRMTANSYLPGIDFGLKLTSRLPVPVGLTLMFTFHPWMELRDKDLSKHLPAEQTAPNLYIFVGPRPPPDIVWEAPPDGESAATSSKNEAT